MADAPRRGADRPRRADRRGAPFEPATPTRPTSATSIAPASRRSSASPGSSGASASTTPRRWRSSCATSASRPGSPRGSCPEPATANTGVEQILNSNAHAWVEVYFPGYGWVTFDPTGGGVSLIAPLPSGRPVASRRPGSSGAAVVPTRSRRIDDRRTAGGGAGAFNRRPRLARSARGRPGAPAADRRRDRVRCLAARAARRDDGRPRVRDGRAARVAVRLRAAPDPDGLRVRRRARRGPADRPPRAADRRPGEGRDGLRPRRSSATIGSRACGPRSAGCGSALLRLAFRRKERRRR